MAEIYVTSTADSGAGSLRQAIADAQDGDVILFDSTVFPPGQTTIFLSSYITIDKSISIYGGESDGNGGYTSGAIKQYYVYRDVGDVRTKVVIASPDDAQEDETVLFENVCRVALDGQETHRCSYSNFNGNFTVAGVEFKNGVESNTGTTGGGFAIRGASRGTLIDCAFVSCSAASGGAFESSANGVVSNGCNFTTCIAHTGTGGGVYLSGTSQNTLNDCIFDGCSAVNGGGVYSASTSQNTLNDCVISGCSATSNGGGAYSTNSSQNTLNDCTFDDCSATGNGGGFYTVTNSLNTLTNCIFTGCSATSNGGGAYLASSSQNTLTNCAFNYCSGHSYGGGVTLNGTSRNTLINCVISNCSTNSAGGGVYSRDTSINTLNDCTITSCSASNGGAVGSVGTSQNALNSCIFNNCSATNGGGVYSAGSAQSTFNDCKITSCTSNAIGGAFYLTSTSQNTLNNCSIDSCSSTNGGAVGSVGDSRNTLNECYIANCTVSSLGAGLYVYNTSKTSLNACTINNSVYASSTAELIVSDSFINVAAANDAQIREAAFLTIASGITTFSNLRLIDGATVTIADGAALAITTSATIGAATFSSDGRGYLATAAGIDTSASTLTNVVLCAYGADVSSFAEVDGVLEWEAANPTTTVLIERADGDSWTTVTQTAGESLTLYLPPSDTVRLFDGVQFFTAQAPSQRTYYYIGGAEGSFTSAADWSLRRGGVAITEPPVVAGQRFIVGDIAEDAQEE